jgi:hypothetical protein
MKRIKIMLLSLFVLATVGGVLAFKAKEPAVCIYKKVDGTCPRQLTTPAIVTIVNTSLGDFSTRPLLNCPTKVDKCTSSIDVLFD